MTKRARSSGGWLCAVGLSLGLAPSLAHAAAPPDDADTSELAGPTDEGGEAGADAESAGSSGSADGIAPQADPASPDDDAASASTEDPGAPTEAGAADAADAADAAAGAGELDAEQTAPPERDAADPDPDGAAIETGSEAEAEAAVEQTAAAEEQLEEPHGPAPRNPKIPPTGNTQMWFRSTSFFDYFGNNYDSNVLDPDPQPNTNNDRFFAIVNYLNFGSDTRLKKTWQISTMMRVDTHNVINAKPQALCDLNNDGVVSDGSLPGTLDELSACNFGSDYRIERTQLRFGNKHFTVTAGDFNVNFGRGVGLSIRKIADIGVDATIKGGRVDVSTKPVDLTVIAGLTNRQQTDFATRQLFRDPGYPHLLCQQTPGLARNKYGNRLWSMCSDIIAGGRFEAKLPAKIRLGGHYNFFWFGQPTLGSQHDGMHSVGGDIQRKRIAKHWDFFGGATVLMRNYHHRPNYPEVPETGIGAYISNSLTFGKTFVLLEGKYYDNYVVAKDVSATTIQYAEAPTLERADQIIPAASNTAGGRILVEQTLGESRVTLIGNYLGYAFALFNFENMFTDDAAEMAHHGYVGLRWRDIDKGAEVQAYAGYRWEGFQRQLDRDLRHTRRLPHAEIYYNHQVAKTKGLSHSISVRAEWRYEDVKKTETQPRRFFHRGNLILGYGLSPFLQFSFIGGFSSEFTALPGEPKLHDQPCYADDPTDCQYKPHLWPGMELRVNFFESSFVRLFAGRQVGGLLCVNGSCRLLPDFEGARMDLVFSF